MSKKIKDQVSVNDVIVFLNELLLHVLSQSLVTKNNTLSTG